MKIDIISYGTRGHWCSTGFLDHEFRTSATTSNLKERPLVYPTDGSWNNNYDNIHAAYPKLKVLLRYED